SCSATSCRWSTAGYACPTGRGWGSRWTATPSIATASTAASSAPGRVLPPPAAPIEPSSADRTRPGPRLVAAPGVPGPRPGGLRGGAPALGDGGETRESAVTTCADVGRRQRVALDGSVAGERTVEGAPRAVYVDRVAVDGGQDPAGRAGRPR